MAKYLSDNGVLYLLQKLKSIFVQKEAGKGLFSGNYADLAGRPTKLSDFVNDAGFQTASQVQAAIASAGHLTRQIVSALPNAEDADEHTIYMIEDGAGNNRYQEWMLIDGEFEIIGGSEVDLSGYLKASDISAITNAEIDSIASGVFT